MNISAKTEYACLAVLELAARYDRGGPVRIRDIADAHGIPSRFLVQILLQLKGAGLVGSTRGVGGGYQLLRDPAQISLGEVMSVIDGSSGEVIGNTARENATSRTLLRAWQEVASVEREMLSSLSFADLVERVRGQSEPMYYI